MDAKETIKKYIQPKLWIKVLAIILIAVAVEA